MNQFIRFPIQIIESGIIEFMHTSHFRVYACLDSYKNRKGQAFPSLETIRTKTKLNRGTIQKTIKDLIEWALIKKAYIKREKGSGYRIIYTLPQEPSLKKPCKKIREKIFSSAKQKRDLKGRFTELKQPSQRTVLKRLKQPSDTAIIHEKKSKQPNQMAATNKPNHTANHKSVDTASIQSLLTSIEPVLREDQNKSFTKEEEKKKKGSSKIDAGEKAWEKAFGNLGRSK